MRARFAAWLVTGPVGHAYAGVLDFAALARTLAGRRLRARGDGRRRA